MKRIAQGAGFVNETREAVSAEIAAFAYGERPVLRGVSFSVQAGETFAVLGPSGCGKSTLLRVLAGLLPRDAGQTLSGAARLFGSSPEIYRQTGRLSVMFQEPTLLPHLNVRENIELPLRLLKMRAHEEVDRVLERVGLSQVASFMPRALSGGMRTRVALARAFVTRPQVLFLDEPFTGLDIGWKQNLYHLLAELRASNNTTVFLVTHDLQEAIYNSTDIAVLGTEGSFTGRYAVEDPLPRPYPFSETATRHASLLQDLTRALLAAQQGALA